MPLSCSSALVRSDMGSQQWRVEARHFNPKSSTLTRRDLVLERCSHGGRVGFWLALLLQALNYIFSTGQLREWKTTLNG